MRIYCCLRRRRAYAAPASPVPNRNIVAGSGTAPTSAVIVVVPLEGSENGNGDSENTVNG